MKPFVRILPKDWNDAALALEAARKANVAAEAKGAGTDLLDRLKERTAAPDRVVDLRRLDGHRTLRPAGDSVSIGALVTLTEIAEKLGTDLPALAEACEGAATPQIRNAATIGGNLCQRPRCWYFRSADFTCLKKGGRECFAQKGENTFHAIFGNGTCAIVHPSAAAVALEAYGATIETISPSGRRSIPIDAFFVHPEDDITAENVLWPAELIVEIVVPKRPGLRSAYRKLKQKQAFDWPLADVAVAYRDDAGTARDVRIVLGSVAPVPFRSGKAEALVEGKKIDGALAAAAGKAATGGATPLSQNAYKVPLIAAMVRRTLLAAAGLPDGTEKAPQA
ncbi:MAG: FAD binding domain-containing protein [Acidithiobacillales bacterium]